MVQTDFSAFLWDDVERRAGIVDAQALPRLGQPDEIGGLALYLASDAGSFVNGIDLVIDGGVITGNRFSAGAQARRELVDALKVEIDAAG